MSYELVDEVIAVWVERHAFTLFREFGGVPSRFVYLSSDDGECCQISIDTPMSGEFAVYARDIDTREDEKMDMHWRVAINDFGQTLEDAVASVKQWWQR